MLHTYAESGATAQVPGLIERREFARRQVALDGELKVPLRAPLPCRMLNVSRGGALLEVGKWEWVPNKFSVKFGNFQSLCHVRHRDKSYIGVEFDQPFRYDPMA